MVPEPDAVVQVTAEVVAEPQELLQPLHQVMPEPENVLQAIHEVMQQPGASAMVAKGSSTKPEEFTTLSANV